MRATQCPTCSAAIPWPDNSCWQCEVDLEVACGDCGFAPYDLGSGICFGCENEPKTLDIRQKQH